MVALRYKDEHNKVGYLLKPTESDDYHQIIDFLSASHIRYALTTNVIIFDSLVKQFWSMATLRAPELGPPAILATIDKTPYTITKEVVRSRLQLADDGGQPSRGEEDPITLTALSFVVSTLMQKVHSLDAELHNHKRLFKDVVGNPCAPTAVPLGDFDVPPCPFAVPLTGLAVPLGPSAGSSGDLAIASGTSVVPGAASAATTDASTVSTGSLNVPAVVTFSGAPVGVSSKGKSSMVEVDIPVKARTFKQMEEDRLGEAAAKRLHDEELAQMESERVKAQRKRQQEVLDSAMYYNEFDWLNIRAQVEANASLSKTLLCDDVSKDNFPARMAALIKKKRQALAEQLFKERQNQPMSQKSLGRKHMHKPKSTLLKLDLDAPDRTFLKVVVNENSDDEDSDDEVWSAVVGWEVLPTPLGAISALYRIDSSTKHFASLRQILHMVDRHDLMKLYGLVGERVFVFGKINICGRYEVGDVSYPLSIKLTERMLMHKLEIDSDIVRNDLTTAEQLIQVFNLPMLYLLRVEMVINSPWIMPIPGTKELASPEQTAPVCCWFKAFGRLFNVAGSSSSMQMQFSLEIFVDLCRFFIYVVPTGRVIVPTSRYVVPTGRAIVATGRCVVPADMAPLPPRDQRHPWLRYQLKGYTEEMLGGVRRRITWRQFILALRLHIKQEMAEAGDFLGPAPSYVLIRDPVRRLCHKMIAYSIFGRGQAPEKANEVAPTIEEGVQADPTPVQAPRQPPPPPAVARTMP
nr:ribonuclease H-like domain-containing protein [Tanacetum cinerariifolium]